MKNNILIYDIETAPMEVYTHYIGNKVSIPPSYIIKESFIICIAYKWMGRGKPQYLVINPSDPNSEKEMLETFFKLVHEADAVYGQNSNKFDNRWLRSQAMLLEVETPWPNLEEIDLLNQTKRTFRLPSYRLDYLAKRLGHGGKDKMEFGDWAAINKLVVVERFNHFSPKFLEEVCKGLYNMTYAAVIQEGEKALTKMVKYNCKDVLITEKVIDRVFKYLKLSLKEFKLFHTGIKKHTGACPQCHYKSLVKNGTRTTRLGTVQKYVCKQCGVFV